MSKSPTLDLTGIVPSLEKYKSKYDNLVNEELEFLNRVGVKLPEQLMVDGEPVIPSIPKGKHGYTFDQLDLRGVSNLLANYVMYLSFLWTQLGIINSEKRVLKAKLNSTETEIMVLLPPPESSKKTRVKADKRVQDLEFELLQVEIRHELLKDHIKGIDEQKATVSREVTIREKELDGIKRSERAGKKPTGNQGLAGGRRVR